MAPPHEALARGLLRAWRTWHAAPGTGAAPRHWPPPRGPGLFKGQSHKVTHAYGSHSSSPSLSRPFLALLRSHVDPALRGALQVLRETRPTPNNILTLQFRRAAASAQTVFARAAKRPTVDVCRFGYSPEVGLQTARRHFSQSTVQTAQQAVLGIRLAADEARDKLFHDKYQHPSQKKTLRRSSKRKGPVVQSQRFKTDCIRTNKAGRKSSVVRGDGALLDQLDLYFPEPATAPRASQEVAAEIIVPLDPDLSNIWDLSSSHSQPSAASAWPKQGPLYDGALGTASLRTNSAYETHLQKTRELQQVLRDLCACVLPCEGLAHAPHAVHGVGYKIVVPGYSAEQLREILIHRLGVEQGLWFGKLLRDVAPSPDSMPTEDDENVGHCSPEHKSSAHSSPMLMSPPVDDYDTVSLSSSWDGMLYEPPPDNLPGLEFSSGFIESLDESRYPSYAKTSHYGLYPSQYDDDSLYLQDSR